MEHGCLMRFQRPMSLIWFVLLSALVLLSGSGLIPAMAQSTVILAFGDGIAEDTVDSDGDGLREYLLIEVELKVYEPGSYGVHGSIYNEMVIANAGPVDLSVGSHMITLRFSGGGISTYGSPGRIEVQAEAFSREGEGEPVSDVFVTSSSYDPADFERPEGTPETTVNVVGDQVIIESPVLRLMINQTRPRLSFSYTGPGEDRTLSSISYEEVLAYNDLDGDGIWDENSDRERYSGDLERVDWKLKTDFTSGYDISLYGVLPLTLVDASTVTAWAKVTFHFSSDAVSSEGNSLKFDIDIELWQSIDADSIAVMHTLRDESGMQKIEVGPGDDGVTDDPHVLRLVGEDGKTQGLYSWNEEIKFGTYELDREGKASTWFSSEDSSAMIWFSYPLDNDTRLIHHDPTIGMDPRNMIEEEEEPDSLETRPILMIGGLVLGILVVGATILLRYMGDGKGPRERPRSPEDTPRGGD